LLKIPNPYLEGSWIHAPMLPQDDNLAADCFAPSGQGKHDLMRDSKLCSQLR